ncbi:chondroitin sulfate proteoglycan 5-like isoform X2 [Scleropages formosus]|uniref:chondroitin sulfate proteoglycan 5-like isoform X2 n=1 Tax=Scleropages formosus TaxID=113540 RepID=UPI000877F5A3|nr:chondroitin sulfate proteoglycan 5-like isoform X2 [Scleropages formosus]
MDSSTRCFYRGFWRWLTICALFLCLASLCAHGDSFGTNITELKSQANSTSLSALRAARRPRGWEEGGSGMMAGALPGPGDSGINHGSVEDYGLLDATRAEPGISLSTVPPPHSSSPIPVDSKEEVYTQSPKAELDAPVLNFDRHRILEPPEPPSVLAPPHPEVLTVDYFDSGSRHRELQPPSREPAEHELQGANPTSWTLENFYDYPEEGYSTTEVYPDEDLVATTDMEDENGVVIDATLASVPFNPRLPGSFSFGDMVTSGAEEDEEPPVPPGVLGSVNGSNCQPGYVRSNTTCRSPCELYPTYCLNGGQCYLVEGMGVFCRCNVQDYIWHKGSRCESIITEFQVLCIAVGAAAFMVLLLLMITVFFGKKLHVLKTENNRLRKRSKYRPTSEQHNDNFSLSTIAEGSHPNVRKLCETPPTLPHARALAYYDNIICQDDPNIQNKLEDPVKAPPPIEDEPLNIQNSLTPKHENKVVGEENSSDVNSLQNNMM